MSSLATIAKQIISRYDLNRDHIIDLNNREEVRRLTSNPSGLKDLDRLAIALDKPKAIAPLALMQYADTNRDRRINQAELLNALDRFSRLDQKHKPEDWNTVLNTLAPDMKTSGQNKGYPAANFAIAASVSPTGQIVSHLLRNTGQLGRWLEVKNGAPFTFQSRGEAISDGQFSQVEIDRSYPLTRVTSSDPRLPNLKFSTQIAAPIGENDAFVSSLPTLQVEMTIENTGNETETLKLGWNLDQLLQDTATPFKRSAGSGLRAGNHAVTVNSPDAQWDATTKQLKLEKTLNAGEKQTIRLAIALHDPQWYSAKYFSDAEQIADYTLKQWDWLKQKTEDFQAKVPKTGDRELDEYLEAYMLPAIILTKMTKNNEVLTMGYSELNQRDSFWTSYLHLALFPDLEKKMIDESATAQRADGKIPTTILPVIERHDDLDINAYFILRAMRWIDTKKDTDAARQYWPAVTKAMDWLIARDFDKDGLPEQKSFWGDWKDVQGVQGRKYSPYAGMLYLAALKQCANLAEELGDTEALTRYKSAYGKGSELLNRPVAEGGLWAGTHYQEQWYDKRETDKVLQDQVVGVFFDVVPKDRADQIFTTLNTKNWGSFGVRETYPYYPASFGYEPGTYHNGGVWPWLSFVDAWSRIKTGRTEEGIKLVKEVAQHDLVETDWLPHEYLHGETGQNRGHFIQGWNANLFGLIYYGLGKGEKIAPQEPTADPE